MRLDPESTSFLLSSLCDTASLGPAPTSHRKQPLGVPKAPPARCAKTVFLSSAPQPPSCWRCHPPPSLHSHEVAPIPLSLGSQEQHGRQASFPAPLAPASFDTLSWFQPSHTSPSFQATQYCCQRDFASTEQLLHTTHKP